MFPHPPSLDCQPAAHLLQKPFGSCVLRFGKLWINTGNLCQRPSIGSPAAPPTSSGFGAASSSSTFGGSTLLALDYWCIIPHRRPLAMQVLGHLLVRTVPVGRAIHLYQSKRSTCID
jgi:hypothetical protein